MSHVINSCALTGEKPCINKAIHALLMHGYATFNMIVPGPQICCRYEICTAWPQDEHSLWKLRSRDICEKAKQNSARNNAIYSKCFQFLCNNSDQTWFFNALTFARPLGRCWKDRCLEGRGRGFQHLPRDLANVNALKNHVWSLYCCMYGMIAKTLIRMCCIWRVARKPRLPFSSFHVFGDSKGSLYRFYSLAWQFAYIVNTLMFLAPWFLKCEVAKH